ncbi:MAG TPA: hypothetical protein VF017_21480 [Thermoanaerobaculia bacterium]|nr:hypothetical protein [Thermoanaerobaculia bacterium]
MRAYRCLLSALLLAAGCASTGVRSGSVTVLPLSPYVGKLRSLELTSPPGGRLLFDTGGGLTLLSPDLAARAGCAPYTRRTGLRMSGERFDVATCGPVGLGFGNLRVAAEAGVFDLATLLPAGLPKVDGLASLQTFAGLTLTIDLARSQITVGSPPSPALERRLRPLGLRVSHSFGSAGLDVFLQIDGRSGALWFELDSGNLDEVLISSRLLGELPLTTDERSALQAGATVEIQLPIRGLGPVAVRARQAELIHDGVLNAAFLERYVVVLDLAAGRAWVD